MIKNLKSLFLFLPIFFVACASVDTTNLSSNKWKPVFIEGATKEHQPRAEGALSFIEFSSGRFEGLAGDNLFKGVFEIDSEGYIENAKLSATNIKGANLEYDTAFLSALKNASRLSREGDKISLYSQDDKLLMQLVPLDSQEVIVASVEEALPVVAEVKISPLADELLGSKWQPAFLEGSINPLTIEGDIPFVEFAQAGKINGMSGDNLFNGDFIILEGNTVKLGNIATTRMMGVNGEYEQAFLNAINNIYTVEVVGDALFFYAKDGTMLMELRTFDERESLLIQERKQALALEQAQLQAQQQQEEQARLAAKIQQEKQAQAQLQQQEQERLAAQQVQLKKQEEERLAQEEAQRQKSEQALAEEKARGELANAQIAKQLKAKSASSLREEDSVDDDGKAKKATTLEDLFRK